MGLYFYVHILHVYSLHRRYISCFVGKSGFLYFSIRFHASNAWDTKSILKIMSHFSACIISQVTSLIKRPTHTVGIKVANNCVNKDVAHGSWVTTWSEPIQMRSAYLMLFLNSTMHQIPTAKVFTEFLCCRGIKWFIVYCLSNGCKRPSSILPIVWALVIRKMNMISNCFGPT